MAATELSRDPIVNVIHKGIKRGVRVALENDCHLAVVILTFSGIDAMAYLGMPACQVKVHQPDFVRWCERYIRFEGPNQLTGLDLYGARCGALHVYGTASRLSRKGECREVIYSYDRRGTPILYRPDVEPHLVIVSVEALAEAFLTGVDRFLVDLFSDKARATTAEKRFQTMYHTVPARTLTDA